MINNTSTYILVVESQLAVSFMEKQWPMVYHPRTAGDRLPLLSTSQVSVNNTLLAPISNGLLKTIIFLLFIYYFL